MIVQESDKLASLLKAKGYSVTGQRRLVLNTLTGREPMTMHELIYELEGKMDRASVYRTVALFETLGIMQRLNFGWKYKIELTDIFEEHHHHMTCLRCSKIVSISEDELESFINNAAEKHGFKVESHQVEIQGYCSRCRT